MPPDRRQSPREPLDLPMSLPDGTAARTRNVSTRGLYFSMPADARVDSWVRVEFAVPAAGLMFRAAGQVLRIDRTADHSGVALRLHAARVVPID